MSSSVAARVIAHAHIELLLTLRRGESVLLTLLIPMGMLGFFSTIDVLPTGDSDAIDFLLPGVLALAIMSSAFTSVAIATGFERQMGVLKRLGATPLTRGQLLVAKTAAVVVIQLLQVAVLVVEGLLLGFDGTVAALGAALAGAVLATIAFAGLGLLMAGTLPALTTLAAANAVYLVLLMVSGMVVDLAELPGWLQGAASALPSTALAEVLRDALADGTTATGALAVLAGWAVAAPLVAARLFRWE